MLKKIVFTVVTLLAVLALLGGIKGMQIGALIAAGKNMMPPPAAVAVAEVQSGAWESSVKAVGSIAAVQGVLVSAEVAGVVSRIAFESGATVKAGDVLVELDASIEKAQLESVKATADLALITLKRNRELREKNTISQSELDAAESQAKQAQAEVLRLEATTAKRTIRAPFDGRLGIRQVNLGQFLANGGAIVGLQSLDPVYVDFSLPQHQLDKVAPGFAVRVSNDAAPNQQFEGKVKAISSEVDVATRSVRVRAELPNQAGLFRPGMFASVEVVQDEKQAVNYIPITAVIYAAYGDSVYVVESAESGEGKVVRQQFVRLGAKRGDFVSVTEGVTAGQLIVSAGAFKLRNGMNIAVKESDVLDPQLNPNPADS